MKRVIFVSAVFALVLARREATFADGACDELSGAAFGLCNAYCEAMDCDSPDPHASEQACTVVAARFERVAGTLPPCECDLPNRIYTLHDPTLCRQIEWGCHPPYQPFLDDCGCGCEIP